MISVLKKLTNTANKKRLIANFASLTVLRGFQFFIPLISLPYLVRTVGIENFGLINFALSLGVYFSAIIRFGFGVTATREIARHRDDLTKLAQIYSATLSASLILTAVSIVLFSLIVLSIGKFNTYINLYLFTLALISFQSLFPIWFFQGMEKMKYITLLNLGTSGMFLISLFVFVKQQDDFVMVPLLHAIAALITFLFAILLIRKQLKIKFNIPKWHEIQNIYQEGWHAFVIQFIPNLYTNSVTFMLGIFASNEAVGLFVAARKIVDAVGSIAYIFSNTFLPFLSRSIEKHNLFQMIMLSVSVSITCILIFSAPLIVEIMYGDINQIVTHYLIIMSIAIPLIFMQLTYGNNYLMLVGKDREYKNIILIVSTISLSYSILSIYKFGAWGAIFTLIFTRIIISIFAYKEYHTHEKFKKMAC